MMKRRGFTLVEMIIVVAIIATLLGIGFPMTRSVINKSREATCLNNLRSLGVALQTYLQEHGNIMPELKAGRASKTEEVPVLDVALLPYLETPDAFRCPADKLEFERSGCSYLWNSTQNGLAFSQLSFFGIKDRPDKIPLIIDKEHWHPGGTNYLYADLSSSNKPRFSAGKSPP
ncbi:MAG: type II secretion system protein [Luteolibacter sp.]|uniref:type II secretion system protein n=1 Tax=Luteolibacter sp. TaxID=1962973 RepID=UPI00326660AA